MGTMSRLAGLLLVLVASTTIVSAEYTKKDAVVVLTEKNFEKEVLNSPDYWLVEFYAPW
jgi:protein disulfide-isomerase A6